ncbi:MAG: hypothetical protein N2039_14985 [Gemmataceae bacterium]|nr:hypothetical protein [Gemmataceae bacterium]
MSELPTAEVEPHDSSAGFAADPRSAWRDAVAALRWLGNEPVPGNVSPPPGWVSLVAIRFPAVALPFASGHFPQMVRDLSALLRRESKRMSEDGPIDFFQRSAFIAWVETTTSSGRFPEALLGLGLCRLSGDFDLAERFVAEVSPRVPKSWRAAWDNELAALAWFRGDQRGAEEIWKNLPERPPIVFNRGLAALFTGRAEEARQHFEFVCTQLPEDTSWHQLAEPYSALSLL